MFFLQEHAYYGHSVLHWYLPHLFTLRTIMNVRKYLVLGSLALAGCQSPVDDMLNNNFVQIKAEPAPSQIIGFWTGNMGPYLASLSFDKSGNGYFCYSYGTADVIQKVKYAEDTIFIQDGVLRPSPRNRHQNDDGQMNALFVNSSKNCQIIKNRHR